MGKAWIDGAPAPFPEAVAAAALRLAASRFPLVTGLDTDVAGMRAAVRLAERAGGVLDHSRSADLYRTLDVIRRTGLFRGVPAELRRRTDRVLLVGGDAAAAAPELLAYLLGGSPDLGRGAGAGRAIVWLGGGASAALAGLDPESVPLSPDAIAGFVGMMRARLGRRRFDGAAPGAAKAAELADWLAEAAFATVVWSAGDLDDLAVETLVGLVAELNAFTRASAMPLAEAGGAHGAAEVATWLTGYPLRVSFARGAAEHDPRLFAADRLLASGECDLVVAVDARNGGPRGDWPGAGGVPVISIACGPPSPRDPPLVAFEIAPLGQGPAGAVWDERLASFVPIETTGASGLAGAAEVLSALTEALARTVPAGRAA